MIIPDAKCVVNGSKVNATIIALNPLLNMEAKIANVIAPQVQYGKDEVQIIIPQASNFVNEELDVVDPNNTASSRWFITATKQGVTQPGNVQSAFPANKQMPAIVSQNRGKLKKQGGGGSQSNRSSLNRAAGVGSGSQITPSKAAPSKASPAQASLPQAIQSQATSARATRSRSTSSRGQSANNIPYYLGNPEFLNVERDQFDARAELARVDYALKMSLARLKRAKKNGMDRFSLSFIQRRIRDLQKQKNTALYKNRKVKDLYRRYKRQLK